MRAIQYCVLFSAIGVPLACGGGSGGGVPRASGGSTSASATAGVNTGDRPTGVDVARVHGFGPDLVLAACARDGRLSFKTFSAPNTWTELKGLHFPGMELRALTFIDVDNNGDAELLAVSSQNTNEIAIFEAAGQFSNAPLLLPTNFVPQGLTVQHLGGSSVALAVACQGSDVVLVFVYVNGVWLAPHVFDTSVVGGFAPTNVALTMNNGQLVIAASCEQSSNVAVEIVNVNGSQLSSLQSGVHASTGSTHDLAFNSNNLPALVTANPASAATALSVLNGIATSPISFQAAKHTSTNVATSSGARIVELAPNGLDAFLGCRNSKTVVFCPNVNGNYVEAGVFSFSDAVEGLKIIDIDLNGAADLVAVTAANLVEIQLNPNLQAPASSQRGQSLNFSSGRTVTITMVEQRGHPSGVTLEAVEIFDTGTSNFSLSVQFRGGSSNFFFDQIDSGLTNSQVATLGGNDDIRFGSSVTIGANNTSIFYDFADGLVNLGSNAGSFFVKVELRNAQTNSTNDVARVHMTVQ